MGNIIKKGLFALGLLFLFILPAKALNNVNMYFFYSASCPHCQAEEVFLNKLTSEHSNLKIYRYEVSKSMKNSQLLADVGDLLKVKVTGVPFNVIGNKVVIGYAEGMGFDENLESLVNYYSTHSYNDKVGVFLGVVKKSDNTNKDNSNTDNTSKNNLKEITLPLLGKVDPKTVSLPIVTALIGFLDGFNPCSMWVLLFMMSVLITMNDRKKMAYIGLTFILSSATIYFLFMAAWLNLTMLVGSVVWVRLFISLVAVIGGVISLRAAWKNRNGGCAVVDDKKRTKLFDRIKKFTKEKSLIIAILGTALIAISVNLIDMLCSAGLPVVYSEILKMNHVSTFANYAYLLLYVFFFMINDIIIYIIAMRTAKLKGISTKFGSATHLIGGILMIIIGLLLVLKPGWLILG